ncbi:Zinc finger protein [Plakobranchus ocellatus]|uniref:Zinc finger protein n=1 Tax=Plakobranchus ocellatus TaxID=259542 RepID=A0AAV3Y339_9GAST|nr:Zinc finger protein [Plakobranchus ocellatus]
MVPRVLLEKVSLLDTSFKRGAIDIVGPIKPTSNAGHRFILSLVDCATRYAETAPLLSVPEEVLNDQGIQFMSDSMRKVCGLLGIKQKIAKLYNLMCNGMVEWFNATLKTCLRYLYSEQLRQWHR